jgi:hypothetical protein
MDYGYGVGYVVSRLGLLCNGVVCVGMWV